MISDPRTRTVITLDLNAQVARVSGGGKAAATGAPAADVAVAPSGPAGTRPRPSQKPVVNLGTQTIGGIQATGFRGEAIAPPGAVGNILPMRTVSEMWRSDALRIPVLVKTTESFGQMTGDRVTREHVESYTDVITDSAPDPSLFEVPPGFQVLDSAGAPLIATR